MCKTCGQKNPDHPDEECDGSNEYAVLDKKQYIHKCGKSGGKKRKPLR